MERINAKECEIYSVDNKETYDFIKLNNPNEIETNFAASYGLFYNGILVKLITFGNPRFDKDYSWELLVNCTKLGYEVIDGTKKIWDYFVENNNVRSCICYVSKDINSEYENCGFKNIIDLKNTDYNIISYFPDGIVYKITDLNTGKFYIGETFDKDGFLKETYNGSGRKWREYYEDHKDIHSFKREILKDGFNNPKELYDCETKEIRKYCIKLPNGNYKVDESTGCMNRKTTPQPEMPICPECGGILFHHYKTCSQFEHQTPCSECGSLTIHKDWCSKSTRYVCKECGGKLGRHYKTCSQYKPQSICSECGGINGHKKSCSKYKPSKPCQECGTIKGHTKECFHYIRNHTECTKEIGCKGSYHTKDCPEYKARKVCLECGSTGSSHYSWCSQFKIFVCEECRGKGGHHKKTCSSYNKKVCPECGSSTMHKSTCSKYKQPKNSTCSECGGLNFKHKKGCSKRDKSKDCPECGAIPGAKHKKGCSKYIKPTPCPECGSLSFTHKKGCSKYAEPNKEECPECGGTIGKHKKSCSHYKEKKLCSECGAIGRHLSSCSKAKQKVVCSECGATDGNHRLNCSKYNGSNKTCEECGGKRGTHRKTCSKYKGKKACSECGSIGSSHKVGCSKRKEPITCNECGAKLNHHKSWCSKFRQSICQECGGKGGHHKIGCTDR